MGIEYQPPALRQIITGPYCNKRLKNREGVVVAQSSPDGEVLWQSEGLLLDIHKDAVVYDQENPTHHITVAEFSCHSLVTSMYQVRKQDQVF